MYPPISNVIEILHPVFTKKQKNIYGFVRLTSLDFSNPGW